MKYYKRRDIGESNFYLFFAFDENYEGVFINKENTPLKENLPFLENGKIEITKEEYLEALNTTFEKSQNSFTIKKQKLMINASYFKEKINDYFVFIRVEDNYKKITRIDTGENPSIKSCDFVCLPNLIVCTEAEYTWAWNNVIKRQEQNGAFAGSPPTKTADEICHGNYTEDTPPELESEPSQEQVNYLNRVIADRETHITILNKINIELNENLILVQSDSETAYNLLGKERTANKKKFDEIQILNTRISELTDEKEILVYSLQDTIGYLESKLTEEKERREGAESNFQIAFEVAKEYVLCYSEIEDLFDTFKDLYNNSTGLKEKDTLVEIIYRKRLDCNPYDLTEKGKKLVKEIQNDDLPF